MSKRKRDRVKSIEGLQDMLGDGVEVLQKVRAKDLPWARTMISAVNSGNSLLRTEHLIESQAEARE